MRLEQIPTTFALLLPLALGSEPALASFLQTNLVASSAAYDPMILQPELINAWGIAIRAAGLGGHFWITSNGFGTSNELVGDVGGIPLFQDELTFVVRRLRQVRHPRRGGDGSRARAARRVRHRRPLDRALG
jgi:hypothetical protein